MPLDQPFHRYALHADVPATEVAVLRDALDGDDLHLRDRIGKAEVEAQLAEQRLDLDATPPEAWSDFGRDVEVLSTYLSEPLTARELHAEPSASGPRVSGFRLLARRGQVTRLALAVAWDDEKGRVIARGVDMEAARARWAELPAWVQATLEHGHTGADDDP
jgi:hypothetical protein